MPLGYTSPSSMYLWRWCAKRCNCLGRAGTTPDPPCDRVRPIQECLCALNDRNINHLAVDGERCAPFRGGLLIERDDALGICDVLLRRAKARIEDRHQR